MLWNSDEKSGKEVVDNRDDLSPQDRYYMLLKEMLAAYRHTGMVCDGPFMKRSPLVDVCKPQ